MSLNSLRSLSGAATLATTALDTARSTIKAMADAAVPPAGEQAAPAPGAQAVPMKTEAVAAVEIKPAGEERKGVRRGLRLDAYA